MKKIIFFILLIFSLNVLSYNVKEATKIAIVDTPIKSTFRIILDGLNVCGSNAYVGIYYDDNDTADIHFGDVYKFKKIDETHTEISYYKEICLICTLGLAETKFEKSLKWIADGKNDCENYH